MAIKKPMKPKKAGKKGAAGAARAGTPAVTPATAGVPRATFILEPNDEVRLVVGSTALIVRVAAPLFLGPGGSPSPPGGHR